MIKVIGLTGTFGAGKGTLANILQSRGYVSYVLSDFIKETIIQRGMKVTRKRLQDVGNELRKKHGGEILAKKLTERIAKDSSKLVVIDGIRNPTELKYIKIYFTKCVIIGIDASPNTRFKLTKARNKPSDPDTREVFSKLEQRDRGIGENSYGQQVQKCLSMADHMLKNEGSIADLEESLNQVLKDARLV